jgi:nucleotide-binding universal stress UspA family protein
MKHEDIKIIVVPTDFSETADVAINHAVKLAKLYGSEIHLVHVLEAYTANVNIPEFKEVDAVIVNLFEKVEQKLRAFGDKLSRENHIKVVVHAATGSIKGKVVNYAKKAGAGLIVTGTHGASGFREFFMGSNSYRIVSEAPCPVISVNSKHAEPEYKKIVLPIDSSPPSRQKVVYAVDLAKRMGATIYLAELVSNLDPNDKAKLNQKVKQVQEYLTKHGIEHITKEIKGTNLALLTLNFATAVDADLIVMMTEQEPNVSGLFMGPFAQQVVNHSNIPVMSIRPEEHPENVHFSGSGGY